MEGRCLERFGGGSAIVRQELLPKSAGGIRFAHGLLSLLPRALFRFQFSFGLLARTALGAVEATVGSEYGIETRACCCEALRKGAPDSARDASMRAAAHVRRVASYVRDPRLKGLFLQRLVVDRILVEADGYAADALLDPLTRGAGE